MLEIGNSNWSQFLQSSITLRLASLLGGVLCGLSFAPFGIWPLALASLALLIHAIYAARTIPEKLLRGWLFGFGKFTMGSVWLLDALINHAHSNRLTAVLLFAVLVVVLSTLFCISCGFALRLRSNTASSLLIAASICTYEVLISFPIWFSFPLLHTGYVFIDTPIASYAPIGGVWLVGYVAVFSAAAICFAFRKAYAPMVVAFALWLASVPLDSLDWTQDGKELSVVLVQANTSSSGQLESKEILEFWDKHETLTMIDPSADLYVWPESAIPAALSSVERAADEIAQNLRGSLIFGTFERQGSGSIGRTFNVAVHAGAQVATYRKQQLVPFGEYTPRLWFLTPLMELIDYPTAYMSPGPSSTGLLLTKHAMVKVTICYEIAYPQLVNRNIAESDLIVALNADAWFGQTIGPSQQLQVARMRARETGRFLLRVSNVGPTAILGSDGSVRGILPTHRVDTLKGTVHTRTGRDIVLDSWTSAHRSGLALFSFLTSLALLRKTHQSHF